MYAWASWAEEPISVRHNCDYDKPSSFQFFLIYVVYVIMLLLPNIIKILEQPRKILYVFLSH